MPPACNGTKAADEHRILHGAGAVRFMGNLFFGFNPLPPCPAMKSLSSLLSPVLRRGHDALPHQRYSHAQGVGGADNLGFLLAGGAGLVQAFRARGYHKLVTLALAGAMLYRGLHGKGHGKGDGQGIMHLHDGPLANGLKRLGLGPR
jgi:hypothetical protein